MVQVSTSSLDGFPRLLVVDKDDSARLPIAEFLEGLRWNVAQAKDIRGAVESCTSTSFDVIVIDAATAAEGLADAVQAMRFAEAESQTGTIIVYGDLDHPPLTDQSADLDVDLFVEKPLDNKRLPVYIAQASTSRMARTHKSRKVSKVLN